MIILLNFPFQPVFCLINSIDKFFDKTGLIFPKHSLSPKNRLKMVKCWLMSDQINDQREECQRNPPIKVGLPELTKLGVEYFNIPVDQSTKGLDEISSARGYNYRDEIVVNRQRLPNYESRIKQFFEEHLHTDEEIRYILEGAGYFDVRTADDEQWIRIRTEPGDLIILPPGIFHRFTVTMDDFIHAVRLFKGEPVWTPYNRNADSEGMEVCREYWAKYGQKGNNKID